MAFSFGQLECGLGECRTVSLLLPALSNIFTDVGFLSTGHNSQESGPCVHHVTEVAGRFGVEPGWAFSLGDAFGQETD